MVISYALAADHRDRVDRLAVAEAVLPGRTGLTATVLAPSLERLFHLAFNRLPTMNEQLVQGRDDTFFGFVFDVEAGTKKPPRLRRQVLHPQSSLRSRRPARQLRLLPRPMELR